MEQMYKKNSYYDFYTNLIFMLKATFKKKALFTRKFDLYLKGGGVGGVGVLLNCYIGRIALPCGENWTLRKVGQPYLANVEMWGWRRLEEVSWTDCLRNETNYMESRRGGGVNIV